MEDNRSLLERECRPQYPPPRLTAKGPEISRQTRKKLLFLGFTNSNKPSTIFSLRNHYEKSSYAG